MNNAQNIAGKTSRLGLLMSAGSLVMDSVRAEGGVDWGTFAVGVVLAGIAIAWSVMHDRGLKANR